MNIPLKEYLNVSSHEYEGAAVDRTPRDVTECLNSNKVRLNIWNADTQKKNTEQKLNFKTIA